jgi:UDP-N-acetylmuramoylalanine--D-glutamate ligase
MEYQGKRVAVLGLGVENVPLIPYLIEEGAEVVALDEHTKEELGETYKKIADLPVHFRLGPHYLDHLEDFEVIFRTPGWKVTTKKKVLDVAKRSHIEVTSAIKLFFERCPAKIIGVTGTKGKGTTSTLIYEMLKAQGKKIWLGGNIGEMRDAKPALSILPEIRPDDLVVLELSSFQLEDLDRSPHIAVVLSVTPDHLDYHKTFLNYLSAKKQIVRHQNPDDFAVLNADSVTSMEFAVETDAQVVTFSTKKEVEKGAFLAGESMFLNADGRPVELDKTSVLKIPGPHNVTNALAASLATYLAGVDVSSIKKVLETFRGLPHRLETFMTKKDVRFVDDSYSTNPETTIAAVRSFRVPITLIVGGSSKKADFTELGRVVAKESSVKHVVLLGNTESRRIRAAIEAHMDKKGHVPQFYPTGSMEEAVEVAAKVTEKGGVVLLSPAAASFDLFRNYKERGELFQKAARGLS